jgi:hypothetical protein
MAPTASLLSLRRSRSLDFWAFQYDNTESKESSVYGDLKKVMFFGEKMLLEKVTGQNVLKNVQ